MIEQHETLQVNYPDMEINRPELPYKCEQCKAHVSSVHDADDSYMFGLCHCEISSTQNLKRHLEEQHEVFDSKNPIQSRESVNLVCDLCDKGFKRKNILHRI
jgi:hypothetical protein